MTVLFHEMTREQIKKIAPRAIAVMPTSATEQHGPHMAVGTDTLLVTTVAERATICSSRESWMAVATRTM